MTGGNTLEVKINREIRNYTESMFFGLSLRQLIFSALAVAVAVGLYFLMRPYAGTETVSWVCVLGAAPFAALGFFTYHGMAAEQSGRGCARRSWNPESCALKRPPSTTIS